jgi:hypothetical protein
VTNERKGMKTGIAKMNILFFDYENKRLVEVPETFKAILSLEQTSVSVEN